MYAMNGADLGTLSAAGALVVVDGREVIDDLDCAVGAGLLALAAGDTAVLAALAYPEENAAQSQSSLIQVISQTHLLTVYNQLIFLLLLLNTDEYRGKELCYHV